MKLQINSKGKVIDVVEKEKKKNANKKKDKFLEASECLEKLRHTILINYNHGNLKFGVDEFDHTDCESLEEFVKCYEILSDVIEGENF